MVRPASCRSPARGGFTLFEVLAAVLVLGLFYSVLAAKASQGMRAEGENLRRLEASLVADESLLQLEALLATGTAPPVETTEEVVDDFVVVVEVSPLDLLPLLPPDAFPEDYEGDSLLALSGGEDGFLRTIDVRVRWEEAGNPREVRRTTYAYDPSVIESYFPSGGLEDGTGEEEDGGPDLDTESPFINEDGSPDMDSMLQHLQKLRDAQ